MSDQTHLPSNEPVFAATSSVVEQPTRTNGSALIGMLLALLPTIGFILVLALLYILPKFPGLATSGTVIEIVVLLFSVFMLAAYPLGFILGIIGLRQISKSDNREKGKGLAWTAIALSSGYCLLVWVLPLGGVIHHFAFNQNKIPQPLVSPTPRKLFSEGDRFDYSLFSIGVPQGSGWTFAPGESGISFELKEILNDAKTAQSERTTVARAWYEALDTGTNYSREEFLEFACTQLDPSEREDRFTERQKACAWWKKLSYDCVRLDGQYLDHGNRDHPFSPPLILDSHSLACRHPDFYTAVIFLDYSQRGPEGSIQENVAQRADVFFRDVGMNYPPGTPLAELEYETSQEIQSSEPGTNLAYRKHVRVSRALSDFPASMAVDGSTTNWWGAGARPPGWLEIDLGEYYVIGEVRLLISQSPAGRTIHRVLARGAATNDEFLLIHTFEGFTSDSERLTYKLPVPLRGVRYILIQTTYSPSWVGWREIEVIAGE